MMSAMQRQFENEIHKLQGKIQELVNANEELVNEKDVLVKENDELKEKIDELKEQIDELKEQIKLNNIADDLMFQVLALGPHIHSPHPLSLLSLVQMFHSSSPNLASIETVVAAM